MNPEQIPRASFEKNVKNVFELDSDIKKFGGNQKFVLLKNRDEYFVGSIPNANHSEILESMISKKDDEIEILGGGMFTFYNNEITIDDNFNSSKLGPILVKNTELVEIVKKATGGMYDVSLSQ